MTFTEKQLLIMQFIQSYRAERRVSPTMEEIAGNFGVTKITIYEHLNQLEQKGALKRMKFRARSIELLVRVEDGPGRYVVPFLGEIPAGNSLQNGKGEKGEKTLDLTRVFPLSKQCFAVQVKGNSLMSHQIRHGDYVIVEKRPNPQNGEIVVAVLPDGRAILKRFYRDRSRVRLQAAKENLKTIHGRECEVRGVVVGLLRNFDERN